MVDNIAPRGVLKSMSMSTPTTDGGRVDTYVDAPSGLNVLHAQKYDASGQKVGPELVIGSFNERVLGPYDVAALTGGGYALVYQSASPGGSWGQVSVQGADGAVLGQSGTAAGSDFHLIAASDGGFLASYVGIGPDHGLSASQPLVQLFDATGHSLTQGHIELAGQITGVTAGPGGVMSVGWDDGGTPRALVLDPHAALPATPATPTLTVIDDAGAQTGAVAAGAITDDATPTFRLAVTATGEAFVEMDKDTGAGSVHYDNRGGGIAITAADVARGYIDITLPTAGDGHYYAWARIADAAGAASYPVAVDFTVQAPAADGAGQVLSAHQAGDTLAGGAGADTLNASQGADHLSGGGGADVFVFAHEPWAPAEITDFAVGTDRLDLSGMMRDAGYAGADPVADGYIWLLDDGAGGTEVLFDRDGHGAAQQWPDYVIHLDGVGAAGLTWAKLSGAPTSDVGGSPPPPSAAGAGVVLQASGGGTNLIGGAGDDTLSGAQGPDVMTGGGGADHFVLKVAPWSAAEITDFTAGVDKIDLSGLLAKAGYGGSDPIGDGYVRLIASGAGSTWIYFDSDGRGSADPWGSFVATLDHVAPASLTASDWVFR